MLSIFFIGVAISMDAFSLSVSVGTTNINKKEKKVLAIAIGIMHFIMPLIGLLFGNQIFKILPINVSIINIVIFIYLGISMLIKKDNETKIFKYSLLNAFILAICVSIDSFSIGLTLNTFTSHYQLSALIFAFLSGGISYIGLLLGQKIFALLKDKATLMGGFILILLAIVNLTKLLF